MRARNPTKKFEIMTVDDGCLGWVGSDEFWEQALVDVEISPVHEERSKAATTGLSQYLTAQVTRFSRHLARRKFERKDDLTRKIELRS